MRDDLNRHIIEAACGSLDRIKGSRPLIHNITNYVVMNFTANALLALGASPVMAHAMEEMEEMVGLASALVINIGTLSVQWVESMLAAGRKAGELSIPVVLDPVGAGATRFRTESARKLLESVPVSVLRGNASEVLALAGFRGTTRGVDSVDAAEAARTGAWDLAKKYGITVAVTGVEDFVTDGSRSAVIANGHSMMGRVTGTGCAASAITGAFCAVEKDAFIASACALVTFGIAGEVAGGSNPGPGSFQVLLLDALDRVDASMIGRSAAVSSL